MGTTDGVGSTAVRAVVALGLGLLGIKFLQKAMK